jgi:hypothetical protein
LHRRYPQTAPDSRGPGRPPPSSGQRYPELAGLRPGCRTTSRSADEPPARDRAITAAAPAIARPPHA